MKTNFMRKSLNRHTGFRWFEMMSGGSGVSFDCIRRESDRRVARVTCNTCYFLLYDIIVELLINSVAFV